MTVTCIDVYFQIIQYKANIVKYTHRYVNLICISSKSTSCDGPGFSFSRETIPHIIAHIYTPGYSIYGRIPDDSNNHPQKAVRSPGVAPPPVFSSPFTVLWASSLFPFLISSAFLSCPLE